MSIPELNTLLNDLLDLTWEDLSKTTIERTKWIILDTAFVAVYGTQSPEIRHYINGTSSGARGKDNNIPVIGMNRFVTPFYHAIIHGTAIVTNELDEGNQFAKGHPAAHVFPPAFIAAIENDVSGKEFIRAFVIGYEVSARLAYASNMNDDMHPHGTWGAIGGTVAAGILQGKTKKEIQEAALIAASLPLSTSWQAAVTGMTVRNLYTGISCWLAYQSLNFQALGFQSSTTVVEHLWGTIMSEGLNADLFLKDLWSPPLLEKNYFKLYPSCRFTHSAIGALLKLLDEEKIEITQIETVDVETYSLAARLDDPAPSNRLSAKFSIPYVLSVLLHGESLFSADKESVLSDSSIHQLAKKIHVMEDQQMTALLPEKRPARVTIKLLDAMERTSYIDDASGGYNKPFPKDELIKKFKNMLPDIKDQHLQQTINATAELEKQYFREWALNFTEEMGKSEGSKGESAKTKEQFT